MVNAPRRVYQDEVTNNLKLSDSKASPWVNETNGLYWREAIPFTLCYSRCQGVPFVIPVLSWFDGLEPCFILVSFPLDAVRY